MCARALSHIWLCGPMHCSPPGFSVHGIFQSRILEWIAISFSRGSSQIGDQTHIPCVSCIGRRVLYLCIAWEAQTSPCSVSNEIWFLRETENFRVLWSYGLTDCPTTQEPSLDHMAVKLGPVTQACFSHRDILLFSREYQVGKWPLFLQVAPSGTDPPPYEWTDVESVKALSSWRDISGVRDPALRVGVGKGRQAPVLLVWKDLCNTGCGNETGQQPLLGWNCRPRLGVGGRGSPISWPPLTRAELLLHWSRGRARADCNQDVIGAHCFTKS